jgi:hypothetical protein
LENIMKKLLTTLTLIGTLTGTLAGLAAPATANICLDIRQMVSSSSKDGKTMVFKMKDGTTWVNHLQGYCPDLKFMGFAWRLQSGDTEVCERQQSFQVLQSPEVCVLGKFDAPIPRPAN